MCDHLLVFIDISRGNDYFKGSPRLKRDYKQFNEQLFLNDLFRELYPLKYNRSNINGNCLFNRFHSIFKKIVDKHLPLRPYTNKELRRLENPWITNGIYKSIKTKSKLYFKKLKKTYYSCRKCIQKT